jgi:putative tryptophan/tyrosine transport system substrate-binding protein
MKRREFIAVTASAAAAWPLVARAQQSDERTARQCVAFLGAEAPSTSGHLFEAFSQGLKQLGYLDGKNITLVQRWAEGRSERFP